MSLAVFDISLLLSLSTDELIAIARVLGRPIEDLLLPHQESEVILRNRPIPAGEIRQVVARVGTEAMTTLAQQIQTLRESGVLTETSEVRIAPIEPRTPEEKLAAEISENN